ncbi:uncharacterized protein LOC143450755 isoform X1 [Clavelina lepadiformis]|uniref:uncharacterized protein LOC143450755 isoform X1 n=1 Tax=Clavelina lepadiformis TaxID=159417 RepID=UPI0040415134
MTLTMPPQTKVKWTKQSPGNIQNAKTAQALKRYLDLTLTGTKKNLAEHARHGRKGHPPSPYTFDRPDFESTIHRALSSQLGQKNTTKTPDWVHEINEKICNHNGEAPVFTENFLPSHKSEQSKIAPSRPLSGISTKSAPVVINGEMYYRPNKKHIYLQACNRPASAKEERLTRASKLRNKHRTQSMSAIPSTDANTKLQLKRMKEAKPRPLHLNKDLLPIPCHMGETPHSFIIGARYNCTHFMDSRSFARLGLYVPRKDPIRTFLKTYKGGDAFTDPGSDSDFVGYTSVRGGSSGKMQNPPRSQNIQTQTRNPASFPGTHIRKVVKEAWLSGDGQEAKPLKYKPPSVASTISQTILNQGRTSQRKTPSDDNVKKANQDKNARTTSPSSGRRKSSLKTPPPKAKFNVKGQPVVTFTGLERSSPIPNQAKRNIEAVIPSTE